jgi:DNA polymerase-1
MKLLSSDTIRRCLIADKGMSIFSADFDQIELRVIAALAGEKVMIDAAKRGESLHKTAAVRLWGNN